MDMDIDNGVKKAAILGLNKVLWIQNDLFARHYMTPAPAAAQQNGCTGCECKKNKAVEAGVCPMSGKKAPSVANGQVVEETAKENKGIFGGMLSGMSSYF